MLLGGDLGFLARVVVAGFVVVFAPVVGFLVRRKWHRSVARKEEIRRLLVLASEEIERAEIEAEFGYSYEDEYIHGSVLEVEATRGRVEAKEEVRQQKHAEVVAPVVEVPVQVPETVQASRRSQYQCQVCRSPTTTRCARCKAARYCSGKCQIVHWRQGHKDECIPFTVGDRSHETQANTSLDPSKGEEGETHNNVVQLGGKHLSESVGTYTRESVYPDSSHPKSSVREVDPAVETFTVEKGSVREVDPAVETFTVEKGSVREVDPVVETFTVEKGSLPNSKFIPPMLFNELPKVSSNGSSIDASLKAHKYDSSHRHLSIPPNKIETGYHNTDTKKLPSETSNVVNSGVSFASSAKMNMMKANSSDVDGLRGSSTASSSSSVDGCNESSSEPSTPSSGFWDGTINRSRSGNDTLNDKTGSCSGNSVDIDNFGSRLTSQSTLPRTFHPQRDVAGNSNKIVLSEEPYSSISKIKEPTNGLSLQIKEDRDLDTRGSSKTSSATPRVDAINSDSGKVTKCVESGASLKPKTGSLSLSTPEKLNSKAASQRSVSQESKASEVIVPSNHGRHSVQNGESVRSDKAQELPPCYRDSTHNGMNNSKPSVWKVVDQLKASKLARLSTLGAVSENVAKYNSKGLFPYDMFVKLYHWNKVEMLPCGLMNCGNRFAKPFTGEVNITKETSSINERFWKTWEQCEINPIMAATLMLSSNACHLPRLSLPIFYKGCILNHVYIRSKFSMLDYYLAGKNQDWCFSCEFENLVLKEKDGKSPISPSRIISQIQNIGSHLGNGREEDAHEFLRYVIDTMQAISLKAAGVSASSSLEETSLLGLTFGGYLRSKIECMRCGGKSERHERMMDLTVEIEGDIGSLEDALRQYTHTETLDGENKYRCCRCKSYEKARKKLRILEAPNILTIALKRFQSGKFGKLNKMIKFPEILDLAPYMSGTSDKSPIYRLYGVIVHLDIMNASFSGHYVCYVKNTQNKWFKIDDSSVKAVELERVLTKDAYMLLYARCSPRAPRLIRRSSYDAMRKSKNPDPKPTRHSRASWDASVNGSNNQMSSESFYPNYSNLRPFHLTILEEDASSDKSSSLFSEEHSCSTESSNRDSTFTDDFLDQLLEDMGGGSPWRNSSDSETSSSSSSPSPMYLRHQSIDLEAYASRCPDPYSDYPVSSLNDSSRLPNHCEVEATAAAGEGSTSFLCPDSTKQGRKLSSRISSSRDSGSSRLGWANPFESLKSSVTFRRSATSTTRGRSD